jgi:hypothetical protein
VQCGTLVGDDVGVVVNGHATILQEGDPGADELDRIWTGIYESSPFSWGDGVTFMRIEPTSMWAYAFHPERFPD